MQRKKKKKIVFSGVMYICMYDTKHFGRRALTNGQLLCDLFNAFYPNDAIRPVHRKLEVIFLQLSYCQLNFMRVTEREVLQE